MVKIPENMQELLAYEIEDPKNYKITKTLRFFLSALRIFGMKTMKDIQKREKQIIKRFEIWKKRNKEKRDTPEFVKYLGGAALIRYVCKLQ